MTAWLTGESAAVVERAAEMLRNCAVDWHAQGSEGIAASWLVIVAAIAVYVAVTR